MRAWWLAPGGPGETDVQLVRTRWERRLDGAAARLDHDSGWDPVMASYAELAVLSGLPG